MNDFTKEELRVIANCVFVCDDLNDSEIHKDLLEKIQELIARECLCCPEIKKDEDGDYYMKCPECGREDFSEEAHK